MTEQTPREGLSARESAPEGAEAVREGAGCERAAERRTAFRERIARAISDATGNNWPAQAFLTEADGVLEELRSELDALGRETERAETAERRLDLAHQARRAKEHQLDGIRRALCDVGAMQDDDPYSHADLEDVIRQAFTPAPAPDPDDTPAAEARRDRDYWTQRYVGEGQ